MTLFDELKALYRNLRLVHYRDMFGRISEKEGSLSATEAFAVDVVYLLKNPTVSELSQALGVSQPNATYKVNNLSAKGYVSRLPSENDKRECHITVSDKFHKYYDADCRFLEEALQRVQGRFTEQELASFQKVLSALNEEIPK